ncbi:uncharacterized protein EMH_0091020 [Eimeria mitis]|uniref:Uncharacterized protein n=1 Tax=Eimeria mitis TaxID=44415 RepID=U6JQ68_9EIME|nr:uncharacterized protein EMH_0091020 [Eimeria mitis]CDJ27650.1 hypothetical protein, conserved [Eimeria mitis]
MYTAGLRLYWPFDGREGGASAAVRLLQLLLQFCFSAASLSSRVAVLLLHGGVFSFSCLSLSVPFVCLCRVCNKALLQLLAAAAAAAAAKATHDPNVYTAAPAAEDDAPAEAPAAAATAAAAAAAAAANNPWLTQQQLLLKEIFKAEVWLRCFATLPDFYGPTDVSVRPQPADLVLYLGAPLDEGASMEGPSSLDWQQHGAPRGAAERLLPSSSSSSSSSSSESAEATAAAAAAAAAAAEDEMWMPLHAAAEDCAVFLGLPGYGPSVRRSCCWFAAAAAAAATFIYMCIDGSLTFLSLGGLSLLYGQRLAAGLLLSGAPFFAAACAVAEALAAAAKFLLFSLLVAAERNSSSSSSSSSSSRHFQRHNRTPWSWASVYHGYYTETNSSSSSSSSSWYSSSSSSSSSNKLMQLFSGLNPYALLGRVLRGSSRSSSNAAAAASQQQLLQRLNSTDIEAGKPHEQQQQQQQQQELQQLQQLERSPASPAEPALLANCSSSSSSSSSSNSSRMRGEGGMRGTPTDSEGEDLDEGSQHSAS